MLQGLGAKPIAYDPMLDYWLRMAAGAFALIGGWYLVLMLWPRKFHAAIPWFGALMLVEGIILLVLGCACRYRRFPFTAISRPAFWAEPEFYFCHVTRSRNDVRLFSAASAGA